MEVIYIKKLIIAEKPDVMRKFLKVLEPSAKGICFSNPYVYYYEGINFVFASACGHLFQAVSPEEINEDNKKWQAVPLSLPDILPLKLISQSSQYFKCIESLVKRKDIDEIVVCTDPDREGQLIWSLISRNLNISCLVTRVWIKEWTNAGLTTAFNSRKDNKVYKNLEDAALARLQADYIIGLTGTRTNTFCFGGYKNVINEGRVQTPTRHIIGLREKEIQSFVPHAYSQIVLQTQSDETEPLSLQSDKLDSSIANSLNHYINGQSFIIQKEETQKKSGCPLLYKTNSLLIDASLKLGFDADKVTNIIQKLYQDYGLTTYPRTEIQQISTSSAKDVMKIVNSLDGIGLVDDIINEIKTNHLTYQNHLIDSAGGEMPHEAITPTYDGNPKSTLSHLTSDERSVYELIVKQFLQGFYPPAIIAETKVSTNVSFSSKDYLFSNSGKMIIEANWMKIMGIPKDSLLPHITDNNCYAYISSKKLDKLSTSPPRYTEASLLNAMEHAGRYVEDEESKRILKETKGIGTGATRKDIIKNLYKNEFLTKKGKTIYPTGKLMTLMAILPDSPLTSPKMTADLEGKLADVENGKITFQDFMKLVHSQVDELIDAALNAPKIKVATPLDNSQIGVCPFCGKPIRENSKSFYCTGYKDGCSFSIWKEIAKKKITVSTAKTLIEKGSTGKLKGFVSTKTGKEFEAKLVVNTLTHRIEFKFK